MKNMDKKRLIHTLVYLGILIAACVGSIFTGLFDSIPQLMEGIRVSPGAIMQVIVMAMLVLVLQNLIVLVLSCLKPKTHRGSTLITLLSSFMKYLAVILIICWGLTILGVDVGTVAASVGILALVVGFGAESLIADVVTGVFMLFENQYNVGDIVEVGGFRGTVRNIGVRATVLEDSGGNVKIISNSNMTDILNRSNRTSRSMCIIGVPYELDLESFEEKIPDICREIYEKNSSLFKSAPVYLGVESLGASSVNLQFVAEVEEADIYNGNRKLNHDLLIAFRKAGVEVPFDQLDVHNK